VLNIVRQLDSFDVNAAADAIGCARLPVASSIARLGKRGFLRGLTNDEQPVTSDSAG
jgi:hypothetical protein